MYEDAPGTTVSRLLQVPQYVVLTASEVMFSVTGLGFAYSQVCNTLFTADYLQLAIILGSLSAQRSLEPREAWIRTRECNVR